ncbi:MAG TPA: PLP-dependent aminotransferase family protein [Rectinemataceae bacterium]|nr:PLP-dependent aminotransferase family protein [Rectinemataceae bacterium]
MKHEKRRPLYERFAAELEGQIRAGTFPIGSRLPALRESSLQRRLSLTTVLQAYRLLEMRGVIEARPQSGYYVKFTPQNQVPDPGDDGGSADPTAVSIDDLSMQLIKDTHNSHYAQFGAAFPDPDLLPTTRLNRILAELAREGRFSLDTSVYPEGADELRVQVAQRAYSYGCAIRPDELVITAGCSEALSLCLQALCSPGDLVAIESPTYFGILPALEALHLKALEIPTRPGLGLSLEALRFAVENHPVRAAIVMTNFNNPLGSCMPDEAKRELVAMLEERGIPLIEDDIYGELYFSERRPSVAKSFEQRGGVLLCSSFSKDISPGYRIGWVAPGRHFPAIQRLKMALNNGTSVLPQMTIARYLESGGYDIHLRKIRKAYAQKVMLMTEAIEASFPVGTRIARPLGGYVIWLQLPGSLDSMRLYRKAIQASITIAPGYIFSPSHRFQDYVRLNAAVWSEKTEKDLVRLGALVGELLATD